MSVTVLSGEDLRLPPRAAALARYAVSLTAEPWALAGDLASELAAQGFDGESAEAATVVIAMFNYLTRVADASGIEFDYASPLPAFEPDRDRSAAARPDRSAWPTIPAEARTSPRFAGLNEAWQRWHDYVLESDEPLTHRERQVLALAAARECCDGWRADELHEYEPKDAAESALVDFASKLSCRQWQMDAADLDALRGAGYPESAVLHAISVVALQNAESRLAMGRAMVNRCFA